MLSWFRSISISVIAFLAGFASVIGVLVSILVALGILGGAEPIPRIIIPGPPEVTSGDQVEIIGSDLDLVSDVRLSRGIEAFRTPFRQVSATSIIIAVPSTIPPGEYHLELETERGALVATGQVLNVSSRALLPTPVLTPTLTATPRPTPTIVATLAVPEAITALQSELNVVHRSLAELEADVASLESQPNNMEDSVTKLQTRLSGIEEVILDDPVEALEGALLRRDLDNLNREVSRVDSSSKWAFGILISTLLVLLGLALTIFFQQRTQR